MNSMSIFLAVLLSVLVALFFYLSLVLYQQIKLIRERLAKQKRSIQLDYLSHLGEPTSEGGEVADQRAHLVIEIDRRQERDERAKLREIEEREKALAEQVKRKIEKENADDEDKANATVVENASLTTTVKSKSSRISMMNLMNFPDKVLNLQNSLTGPCGADVTYWSESEACDAKMMLDMDTTLRWKKEKLLTGFKLKLVEDFNNFVDDLNSGPVTKRNHIIQFAIKLAQIHHNHSDIRLVLSPFCLASTLTMCLLGAKSITADQMRQLLCLDESLSDRDVLIIHAERLQSVQSAMRSLPAEHSTALHNLYVNHGLAEPLNAEFVSAVNNMATSSVQLIDFNGSDKLLNGLNSHIYRLSSGAFKEICPPDLLTPSTSMLLVNAANLKCIWAQAFTQPLVKMRFYPENVEKWETVKATLAMNHGYFKYLPSPCGLELSALEMPLRGGGLLMTFILPDLIDPGLKWLSKVLTGDMLQYILCTDCPLSKIVCLRLPVFRMSTRNNMCSELSDLCGGESSLPFDEIDADFSGISDSADAKSLRISAVLQSTILSVSEDGGEEGVNEINFSEHAYTGRPSALADYAARLNGVSFVCNRPFMYVVHDCEQHSVLFIGKFVRSSRLSKSDVDKILNEKMSKI